MNDLQLHVTLIRNLPGSLMCLSYSIDMLSIGVCTTRQRQTSGQLVQELNVCTVADIKCRERRIFPICPYLPCWPKSPPPPPPPSNTFKATFQLVLPCNSQQLLLLQLIILRLLSTFTAATTTIPTTTTTTTSTECE